MSITTTAELSPRDAAALIAAQIRQRNRTCSQPFAEVIASHQHLRTQLRKLTSENAALKTNVAQLTQSGALLEAECRALRQAGTGAGGAGGPLNDAQLKRQNEDLAKALKNMSSMHELEHSNQRLLDENQQLLAAKRALTAEVDELRSRAEEREEMIIILKKEIEALKAENKAQRELFSDSQEENARLTPMVLQLKEREAELMDQIFTLESQLCAMRQGGGAGGGGASPSSGGAGGPASRAQFTESITELGSSLGAARGAVVPSYIAFQTDDAHDGAIDAVVATENGRHVWTGGTDKILKCWEASNGLPVTRVPAIGAVLSIDSVADLLVTGCVDSTCRIYELGTLRGRCQLTGHQEKVTAAYFSSDGHRVFSASSDRTIKAWDVSRGSLLHTAICYSACNDISVVNDRICSAHFDTTLRFWDARTSRESGEIHNLHERTITSARLSYDGNTVVSLSRDNTVRVCDVRMLRQVSKLVSDKLNITRNHARVSLSPDATLCAAGSSNGCVVVWSLSDPTGKAMVLSKGHSSNVPCSAWVPDGHGLVSVSDRRVVMWR